MTSVWACPGGNTAAGLAGRPVGLRFRDAFLGTVAAGALSLAFGGPALAGPDACTISGGGTIETCSGNQSAGIAITSPTALTTLNVNSLTQAITPASGTNGINFTSFGTVTLTSNTSAFGITTAGGFAYGIDAKSTGSGTVTVTSVGNVTTAGFNALGIYARGTSTVTVSSTGDITTAGGFANGIYARGIGTGSGTVTVTSIGNITTLGGAAGIGAYSHSSGTVTVTSTGNITTGGTGIAAVTLGAGAMTVTSTGNIVTAGNNASGLYARGIGGGAITVTSTGNITTAGDTANGIHAYNLTGTSAVTVTSTGNITAMGSSANGILAESFGGAATVTSTGNITTAGADDNGIRAYSAGAGAVTVASTGNITTGGSESSGIFALNNGAGTVAVTSIGNIATAGSQATGILAYSKTGAVAVTSTGDITTQGSSAFGILAYTQTGPVTVTSTGNITTTGSSQAKGILAQSNGTGAVMVTSIGNITTAGSESSGIFAQGGGAVAVTSTGNITTAGDNASGILANGAGAVMVASTGNIATAGGFAFGIYAKGAGAVTVTSAGNITSSGSFAHGILAQSNGAGAVAVTSAGNIATTGFNANGVLATSAGGPITVTINSGTVSGGLGTGAGVFMSGGSTSTLTNMGTLMALSGLAIQGNTGNDTVNNSGTVIGNVIVASGTNAFNNMAGGVFNAGVTVNLGAGNTLTNAGTLSPGGLGVIQTTTMTGNLVQTATGRLVTDINIAGGTSDRINISGTANLAGAVQLQVQNLTAGAWQQTIVAAAGGATNNGLTLLASPVLRAQLVFANANDVVVESAGINFAPAGLNGNQTALGNALNGAAQTAGLGGPIFNLLLNTTGPGYGAALTQLSGEAATGTQQATFDAMNNFMGTMLDPFSRGTTPGGGGVSGYASEGDASAYASDGRRRSNAEREAYAMFTKAPPAAFEPRWNVWAAGYGGSQTTSGNAAVGSNSTASRIAGTAVGADYIVSPNTIAGFAMAGGGTNYVVANGAGSGRSDLFQVGAFVRHTVGAAYISGALAYGWQDITTNRTVNLAGLDQLQAKFNANTFSGRLEGGYRFVSPGVGVGITPYAAAQLTTFDLPAYAEQALTGTSNFALAYGAKDVTDPRSELGFRTDKSFAMPDGVLTLRGRLAWAHDYDTDRSIGATFQSLPGASFVVNGAAQASDSALTTASIERRWTNHWSIAATFEGEFSNVTSSYAGKGVVRYQW